MPSFSIRPTIQYSIRLPNPAECRNRLDVMTSGRARALIIVDRWRHAALIRATQSEGDITETPGVAVEPLRRLVLLRPDECRLVCLVDIRVAEPPVVTKRSLVDSIGPRMERLAGELHAGLWRHVVGDLDDPVRLEFPIFSLHPGLRPRGVAPDVWPTLFRAWLALERGLPRVLRVTERSTLTPGL